MANDNHRPPGALAYWPAQSAALADQKTIGEALRLAASSWPDRTALIEGTPDAPARRSWRFADLHSIAEKVARALLTRFRPGEHVAIWAGNCPEWVFIELGAAMAGVTLVAANPAYLASELSFVLKQSKSCGILFSPHYRGRDLGKVVEEIRTALPLLREVISLDTWPTFIESGNPSLTLPEVRPEDIAQIQYTSGTTGTPKGAMLMHQGLVQNGRMFAHVAGATPDDIWINPMPMFHTAGCGLVTLGALQTGGAHVLPPAFSPDVMLDLFESERGTLMLSVPTMLIRMLEQPDIRRRDLSSWRLTMLGGAPVPPELVRRANELLGLKVSIGFGQTEASPYITHTLIDDPRPDWIETVGRPFAEIEVRIADPNTGETLGFDAVGEVCTRSCCVMKGYFDNPSGTAAAIDSEGWLHTGDLGSMGPDGYIRIQGRLKDMIIRGGENIYPREVEDVLFTHPAVATVSVIGVPDPEWGEVVAAFIQLRDGAVVTEEELFSFCRQHLAAYKTPRIWRFVEQFPQTASGKIQKFELRKLFLS